MTHDALAAAVGLNRMAVSRIESGKRHVSLGEAIALAEALEVPPADMLLAGSLVLTESVRVD